MNDGDEISDTGMNPTTQTEIMALAITQQWLQLRLHRLLQMLCVQHQSDQAGGFAEANKSPEVPGTIRERES